MVDGGGRDSALQARDEGDDGGGGDAVRGRGNSGLSVRRRRLSGGDGDESRDGVADGALVVGGRGGREGALESRDERLDESGGDIVSRGRASGLGDAGKGGGSAGRVVGAGDGSKGLGSVGGEGDWCGGRRNALTGGAGLGGKDGDE